MTKYNVEDIRNVALCGHGSTGKTTLVDTLLNVTNAVSHQGSVDDGTSTCDFDEEEKQHQYSIEASVVHFDHAGKHFHAIDTPGYPDFIGQAIGALRAADTAAVVVNAQAGIEVNTRRVFIEAGRAGVGRMVILSKMDSDNIDFPAVVRSIQELFGIECVLLNVPVGCGSEFRGVASTLNPPDDTSGCVVDPTEIHESLIESIVEADDEVMERYLEGAPPSNEELSRLITEAVAKGTLIPMVCVSAKTGVGVAELLDAMAMCALGPDKVSRKANSADGEEVEVKPDPAGPLVAQVFKTRIDPFVQKLSFIRVYSGTLSKDSTVPAVGMRKGIKIAQLLHVQADQTDPVDEVGPGGIVAVTKVEELKTGTTLGAVTMPPIEFPTPMVGLAASPKSRGDEAKLSGALGKVCQEDSTFRLDRDVQTKEMVITGMSELHLQIIRERLKRRDKVEVITKEPKIPYRETIQANAEGSYRHKKQTGGRGQFAEVHIRMWPLPKNVDVEEFATKDRFPQMKEPHYHGEDNFLWIDSIVSATIPGNFMPAVEKGFLERINRGVIAGYRVQDVCVEVHFGKHHEVDSSEQAFKTAASMVFRNVFQQARPALLEPIVKIEVTVPGDFVGDINSDMSGRRGRVLGMDSAGGGFQTVTAEVPLAEVTTYARSLSSLTGGQGSYALEFSHYDVVPGNVQQQIIQQAKLEEEEE
jgi:elongation factor G